ncbi:MAG: helix-turn-helix domain-containing protein [Actinobacteria bacterium]|nr:helix-turn-helix domain-containing protein [Actinomycetota bacterium]
METSNKYKELKLLSVKDVAEITQAGLSTVRGWIRDGKLKSVKVGHFRRIRATDLEKFIMAAESNRSSKFRSDEESFLIKENQEEYAEPDESDIEYWEKRFPPLKKGDPIFDIIGIGESGLTDVSENVDKYLYQIFQEENK